MKKFYWVGGGILSLLILAMGHWIFAVNNKGSFREISDLTEQVTALKTQLKDLQVLEDNQKRQGDEISELKKELRNLELAIKSLR